MVTKKYKSNKVIPLHKQSPYSIKVLIKKSTHLNYQPKDKDFYIRDNKLIGFYIRIRPNGNTTYCCETKLKGIGKKVAITIGACELFTAQQARVLATENLIKIKSNINPKDEIEAVKAKANGSKKVALAVALEKR